MKKDELAEKAYRLGREYEKTYRGCSQCVIAALQDALKLTLSFKKQQLS